VTYGIGTEDDLARAAPDLLLDTLADLTAWISLG